MTKYILGGISVPPGTEKDEVIAAAAKKLRRAGIPAARLTLSIQSSSGSDSSEEP